MTRRSALLGMALAVWAGVATVPADAQELPQSPILTIEFERLFDDSVFGTRFEAQIQEQSNALAAENRRIEAALAREERQLTDERAEMDPEEFRLLANAFDQKVQASRREQDEKLRALGQQRDAAQREFLRAAEPILAEIMRDSGATVVVERRSVFISADAIDITDETIARINRAFSTDGGTGPVRAVPDTGDQPPPDAPEPDAPAADPDPTAPGAPDPEPAPEN